MLKETKSDIEDLIPEIIDNCLWQINSAAEEHYQLAICDIIKKHSIITHDIVSCFRYFDKTSTLLESEAFKDLPRNGSVTPYFNMFRQQGGGQIILKSIIRALESIDLDASYSEQSETNPQNK